MSTLTRYVLFRAWWRFLAFLAVFVGIVAGGQVALTLGRGVPLDALLPAMPGFVLLALPMTLPLSIATAVLTSFAAMRRDGELRALASAGISTVNVASRLGLLVAFGVMASALLSHFAMPRAMGIIRENAGRFAQAALVYKVNTQRALFNDGGIVAYARAAEGQTLHDIFVTHIEDDSEMAIHADRAEWHLGEKVDDDGLALLLQDVRAIRRGKDGTVALVDTPAAQYPVIDRTQSRDSLQNPDTWSTPKLLSYLRSWDSTQRRERYSDSQLTLQLRLFSPVALVIFVIIALGLALTLPAGDGLPGVLVLIILVAATTTPAIFYSKSLASVPHPDPGWLLWPLGGLMLAFGLWMVLRPEFVAACFGRPVAALTTWPRLWLRHMTFIGRTLGRRGSQRMGQVAGRLGKPFVLRGLSTLDRHLLAQAVSRWILVMLIGTSLVCLADSISRLPILAQSITRNPVDFLTFFILRIPGFAALWLPLSVPVAGLLVVAPMQRQGTLMMLAASGIPPRRTLTVLIPLGIFAGILQFVTADQIVPRLQPITDALEDRMTEKNAKPGSGFPIAWRSDGSFWSARRARPEQGVFEHVAAFDTRPGRPDAAFASSLIWSGDEWKLHGVVAIRDGAVIRADEMAPAVLGLSSPPTRKQLALDLRYDDAKTSDQLVQSGSLVLWNILGARMLLAIAPLACLLIAIPGFTRWEGRHRLGTASAKMVIIALIPLLALAVAARLLSAASANPWLVGALSGTVVLGIGLRRWQAMRL